MNELCEKVRHLFCHLFRWDLIHRCIADVGIDVAFGRLFYETFFLSYKHFQFPVDLAVLAFPCNQFGHQENATNQVAENILKRR